MKNVFERMWERIQLILRLNGLGDDVPDRYPDHQLVFQAVWAPSEENTHEPWFYLKVVKKLPVVKDTGRYLTYLIKPDPLEILTDERDFRYKSCDWAYTRIQMQRLQKRLGMSILILPPQGTAWERIDSHEFVSYKI